MRLRVATINVPTSVGRASWIECFEETASRADIFGINEVFSKRAKREFIRQAKRDGLSQFGMFKGPNPVFWDADKYERRHANHYRLHGARRSRWAGFNAARYATVVVLADLRDRSTPDVTVINTHWVPRGWKVAARWRTKARKRSRDKVAHLVAAHRARGRVVVVLGDFNMDPAPKLPGVTWVVGARHGVDKIGVACPKGWEIDRQTTSRYPAPTDHKHGVAAEVKVGRSR